MKRRNGATEQRRLVAASRQSAASFGKTSEVSRAPLPTRRDYAVRAFQKLPALGCAALLAGLPGCATQTDTRKQTDAAFQAGQQQALQQLYEARFPVVTVLGPVRNPKLDLTPDLTLARAIVAAGYLGLTDPRDIILHRGEEQTHINPKDLLARKDWPLQPGDRIEIVP